MTIQWHIAQFNLATAMFSESNARMNSFYSRLDEINALADASPGFVWRLQSESGNAADIVVNDDPMLIVNLTVWQSIETLFDFAYKSVHRELLAGRREWFVRPDSAYQVLWWIRAGHEPSVEEAMAKLEALQKNGPDSEAFTFKSKFPTPEREQAGPN